MIIFHKSSGSPLRAQKKESSGIFQALPLYVHCMSFLCRSFSLTQRKDPLDPLTSFLLIASLKVENQRAHIHTYLLHLIVIFYVGALSAAHHIDIAVKLIRRLYQIRYGYGSYRHRFQINLTHQHMLTSFQALNCYHAPQKYYISAIKIIALFLQ